MKRFARTVPSAGQPEIIKAARPHSFFDLVEQPRFGHLDSLRRILSQARQHDAQTIVIEELEEAGDLREENEDIRTRYPDAGASQALRLSFFTKAFSSTRGLDTVGSDEFVGYAVVKRDHIPARGGEQVRIYESVMRPSRHSNNYVRGQQTWTCQVAGRELQVGGYIYAQQNGVTNVCAHVALRTAAARFHRNGDMSYREMNELVGIDHKTVKTGGPDGRGLTSDEMVRVLERAGARCFVGDYTDESGAPAPYQKYLYGSVESGYPAIVFFGTTDASGAYHTIPVFGHTFNDDTWVPSADVSYFRVGAGTEYIPSESWLSMFIAHDDNWGSNFCIPRNYLHTRRICGQLSNNPVFCPQDTERMAYAIGTVPQRVKLSPIRAEVIGADYLFTIIPQMPAVNNPWDKRLIAFAQKRRLVLRPILVQKSEYIEHLRSVRDWDGKKAIHRALLDLFEEFLRDEFYWLVELSVPELFPANRRKVGEVLIRAEVEPGKQRDMASFVLARVPGHFALYKDGGASNPQYRFIPSGIVSHVELLGCEEQSRA